MSERVFNFNAGPSTLPLSVLERAQKEFVSFGKSGMSVIEMSHRDKDFVGILDRAEGGLKKHLNVPDTHAILFLGGGASLQFSMIPMNLGVKGKPVDFINTGVWTQKAIEEAKKLATVNIAGSSEADKFTHIPAPGAIKYSADAAYVHIASNNTIYGTEWFDFPDTKNTPLIGDMSSDILSRPVDASRFGVIFAGAQKNLGPAGVTVVVIRKDLAERADKNLPTMLQYRTHIKERSLYNTPPTYSIYLLALMMEWLDEQGGVAAIEKKNIEKADLLYGEIDRTGFYSCPAVKKDRSRMNVVFRIKGGDAVEDKFAAEAKAAGLIGLKGHRSVGGMRASIYNAHPLEGVQALVSFMKEFEKKNG